MASRLLIVHGVVYERPRRSPGAYQAAEAAPATAEPRRGSLPENDLVALAPRDRCIRGGDWLSLARVARIMEH
jgi:hypothetical protein